jgi:hypothetical protein
MMGAGVGLIGIAVLKAAGMTPVELDRSATDRSTGLFPFDAACANLMPRR